MKEYIAHRINEDGIEQSVRFYLFARFAILKNGYQCFVNEEPEEEIKEFFGKDLDSIAIYRTFYDPQDKKFRFFDISKDLPGYLVEIPEDGGVIDGWDVRQLHKE
jgi:hypothetical protein